MWKIDDEDFANWLEDEMEVGIFCFGRRWGLGFFLR
jgi:hypothetical protein